MPKKKKIEPAVKKTYLEEVFETSLECKWCGEPIIYTDTVYVHHWGRWTDDNGYFCTEEKKTFAEPDV